MAQKFVKTRLLLNFQGFEKSDSENLLGRVLYCADKTAALWNFQFSHTEPSHNIEEHYSQAEIYAKSDDWEVKTKIIQLSFGDIVRNYEDQPYPVGFLKHLSELIAIILNGTLFRYFKVSKLYGLFVIFPLILVSLFALFAYYATSFIAELLQIVGYDVADYLFVLLNALICLGFCRWPGKKMGLLLMLAYKAFTRAVALKKDRKIEQRSGIFKRTIVQELKNGQYDEILIAGHSFGSVWAIMALGQALDKNPDFLKGQNVAFLLLGSGLLDPALMPNTEFIRRRVRQVSEEDNIFWHEFQTKDDPISFYKANMFDVLELDEPKNGYQLSRVNFKHSMHLKRYRKMKKSFYAVHRQYGLYQDKQVPYDFPLHVLSPFLSKDIASNPKILLDLSEDVKL